MDKIALITLQGISNVGENLLGENTEYLIRKFYPNIEIKPINLQPNKKELMNAYFLYMIIAKIFFIISNCLPVCDLKYIFKNYAFKIKMNGYFINNLDDCKAIIYAIGMLKYSTQDFSYVYEIVNNIAKKYNIPVMMSAMSIEKYNENDWRCRQLARAVNNPIVKCITTRDNEKELNILRNKYLTKNKNCYTECVGDPALWTRETYQVNDEPNNSDLIGIGLIRLGIYEDYGYNITKEELFDLYVNIIKELEARNANWALFCNGMPEDYEVGLNLLEKLKLSQSKLLPRPQTTKDLINILLGFKCVMGVRLHSCITSYALGIPIVGLIWDNKLRAFAKKIRCEKYFVEENELNAKHLVDMLEEVAIEKYNINIFNKDKIKTLNSLEKFLNLNGKKL